ncbi:MAG TPA: VOC family protein, partial [Ilumatobacteraceae bacterium]
MAERDGYIPGVPCWADTQHADPAAVLPFYETIFGWTFENVMPEGAPGAYYIGRIRGGDVAAIGAAPPDAAAPPAWNTYVWVDSADAAADRAREAGGTVVSEPFDVMDAGRMAVLADPEGASFCVWEANRNKGSRIVNEHGSVNFNNLATRDHRRAESFYGAVFGWRVLDMPSGLAWALAGYGDHLESIAPGTRENMAAMGAPDGFIDVVAAIEPIGDDDHDTPAHWSITFAVDDVDKAAAVAADAGGTVVAGPADAPWSRTAVIEDPAGARFVASQ